LAFDAQEAESRIVNMARDLTRKFAEQLKNDSGSTSHDMAFLTVMSGIKDVARHLGNIAERLPGFA
jgi:hypothetical protein